MKRINRILPVYAADISGVCSALYELGGMTVMHDASGCNSTYTTHDEPGVTLGYCIEDGERTTFDLKSATDPAYEGLWTTKEVTLKKGMNVFYLSGVDVSCKMRFEISGIDQTKVTYIGAFPREELVA